MVGYLTGIDEPIVALSSRAGAAARGIIRLSGPNTLAVIEGLFEPDEKGLSVRQIPGWRWVPGRFHLYFSYKQSESPDEPDSEKTVFSGCQGFLCVFHSPHSYTGQELVELHLPGSGPLLEMVREELLRRGARPAEPGEFTARAFLNGRLDLTEAEGVLGMIQARSDQQLRAAERLFEGALWRQCRQLLDRLTEILAWVEAGIDFSQEDIELVDRDDLSGQLTSIESDMDHLLSDSTSWKELSYLPLVAVAGPANAGKSTLVNQLLGLDRSIVSAMAGTTRDLLTAPLEMTHGCCMLMDTAGLGTVEDPLGPDAQARAHKAIQTCDLLLWVFDASLAEPSEPLFIDSNRCIYVANKIDLCPDQHPRSLPARCQGQNGIQVSALKGWSIDPLKQRIDEQLFQQDHGTETPGQMLALTARQRQGLRQAQEHIQQATALVSDSPKTWAAELVALEIRSALQQLGQVLGRSFTEDVLGRIFSRFCVGK